MIDEPKIESRFSQYLQLRANAQSRELVEELKLAIISGEVPVPGSSGQQPNYAGGTNYCPNSDLKYSAQAIAVIGANPEAAGDASLECYRFTGRRRTPISRRTPPIP